MVRKHDTTDLHYLGWSYLGALHSFDAGTHGTKHLVRHCAPNPRLKEVWVARYGLGEIL